MPKKKLPTDDEFIQLLSAESIETLITKGLEYKNSHDYEKATACFDQALLVEPNFSEAYYHRGNVFLIKGVILRQ